MTLVPERYQFGDYVLDAGDRRLSCGVGTIHLPPKAFDLLLTLTRRAGQLVTKSDLLEQVWPDAFVEEGILTVYVSILRKELGDTCSRPSRVIETVSGFGYRFIVPVTRVRESDSIGPGRLASGVAEAVELVQHGRKCLLAGSHSELRSAEHAFRAAIDVDDTCTAAHAGLALTKCAQARNRAEPAQPAHDEAKGAALRALALDDRCAEAQLALATVMFFSEWDWIGAERSVRRALDLDADCVEAYLRYGNLLEALGRLDDALAMKLRAFQREPKSVAVLAQLASSYLFQRRYDETIVWAQRALDLDAKHTSVRMLLAVAWWKSAERERSDREIAKHLASFGVPGDSLPATDVMRHVMTNVRTATGASPMTMAVARAELGDMDASFEHLDEAMAQRDPGVVYLAVAPYFDGLRNDARFEGRLARLRLPLRVP